MSKYCLLFLLFLCNYVAKSNFYFLLETCELSNEQNQKIYDLTVSSYSDTKYLENLKEYIDPFDCENLELYYVVMSGETYFHEGSAKKEELKESYLKLYDFAKTKRNKVAYELGRYQEMSYLSSNQQFDKAIEIGISFVQERPHSVILPFMVKKIGRLFKKKGDKKTASEYFKKSFDLTKDNYFIKSKIYIDYVLYLGEDVPKELEKQGETLLNLPPKYPWDKLESRIKYALLVSKGRKQIKQKNYVKALSYFENSFEIGVEISNFFKNFSNFYILVSYVKQGDYINAERIIQAFSLEQITLQNYYSQFLELSMETYRALKKYPEIDKYAQLYINYQKAAFDREQNRLIADVNEKYQTVEKDKELLLQKNTNQTYLFALLSALFLIVFISYLYYRNQKFVKKELLLKQQRTKELEELDTFKSNLFAQMAHEFRTPLTLIQSPVELMQEGKLKGDNNKKYYNIILHNTKHLLHLVNQMLVFSKIDMHKVQLEKTKGDIVLFVKNTVNQFESLAKDKGINFLLYLPQTTCWVIFDERIIQRIILNILHNAIKYTARGGQIAVSLKTSKSSWFIKIEDTGIGIKEENLENIFDSFYRTNQDAVKAEAGFGLGLHIVKELSLLHKGKVQVESQLGKGSTFILEFEVEENEQLPILNWMEQPILVIEPNAAVENETAQNPRGLVQKETINLPVLLIVEDNQDLQDLYRDQLSSDYQVLSASNGIEAMQIIEENIPDIILSDVMMPKMDGIELVHKIRNYMLSSHIPLLLLTALDVKTVEQQGLKAGATDFLTKPVNFEILKLKLKNQLSVLKSSQNQILKKVIHSADQQSDLEPADTTFVPRADNFLAVLGQLDISFLSEIQNIVKANFHSKQFSVDYLSKEIGMSRSNLFLKVKALTGLPITAFIRKYRLHLAKEFIEEGRGNITEAAYSVGILNPSYFTRIFKEEFGISPKMIRKKGDSST